MSTIRASILCHLASTMVMFAQTHNYVPPNGYVPDAKTAAAVAEAILNPIYGEQQISQEKPLNAKLDKDNIWTVTGSMPSGRFGGVATIRIRREDGRVLSVTHGQ